MSLCLILTRHVRDAGLSCRIYRAFQLGLHFDFRSENLTHCIDLPNESGSTRFFSLFFWNNPLLLFEMLNGFFSHPPCYLVLSHCN